MLRQERANIILRKEFQYESKRRSETLRARYKKASSGNFADISQRISGKNTVLNHTNSDARKNIVHFSYTEELSYRNKINEQNEE